MKRASIHNATELMGYIQEVGFLPLLYSNIPGFSADEAVDPDCRYVLLDDGSWDWPLWDWKGPIVTESACVYGKFFNKKAGFVSRAWWPDLYNWRRHSHPAPPAGSIEETILMTLREHGSLITRDLRRACGFTEPKMRSRFDSYVTRLQMACRVVTEDFVYPRDKHNRQYGWGWALLTTPEQLLGKEACQCDRTPKESLERMLTHLKGLLPRATEKEIIKLIK
ncbi:MAG: hypothetical protein IKX56_00430 [Muribaculaceae bacterium]|nr:hypothetical protein [Muribaculaceae bacterium]